MNLKQILVPTDFSKASLEALAYAVELGKPFKAEITVLYVEEPIYAGTTGDMYGLMPSFSDAINDQDRISRESLRKLSADLSKRRVRHRAILQSGPAFDRILNTAKKIKADMIIMATHGRTGLSHMLLGSVAEKVVRLAACPVLTLHTKQTSRRTSKRAKK